MNHITPQELNEKHLRGEHLALIDVRTPAEFRAVHVPFALNLPLDTLSADGVRELARDLPVYLICRSGMRAQNACTQLMAAGFEGLTLVQGGTDGWRSAGLDVELGKPAISLENQVRLIAGGLVLAGTVLGHLTNPVWLLLPASIGAGLIYVGLTNQCAMAMLLARMPWNRGNS